MSKKVKWEAVGAYLHTFSSLHTYHQKHPEDKAKTGKGKDGDIADRVLEALKERVGEDTVEIIEPLTLLMIRKAGGEDAPVA